MWGGLGNAGGGAAPMSREQASAVLARRQDELDRITAALLSLDDHRGRKLLSGGELTGETRRRWEAAHGELTALWRTFDVYKRVLTRAREIAARRPREDDLATLTFLLTGPSVELRVETPPLDRRTLLAPTSERITLDDAVARMTHAYTVATDVVAAADAAWTPLLTRLSDADTHLDATRQALTALAAPLPDPSGPAPAPDAARPQAPDGDGAPGGDGAPDGVRDVEVERLAGVLEALRRDVLADPLSFVRDGRCDTSRADSLVADLEAVRADLAAARRLRDGYPQRLAALEAAIAGVADAETRARDARELALVKIHDPAVPPLPDAAPDLRARLRTLAAPPVPASRRTGVVARWRRYAADVAELEREASGAREAAAAVQEYAGGLIERRDELRGRLDAYKAKALRYGLAEDEELSAAARQARELLWTAPCDLRAATRAVAAYVHALDGHRAPDGGASGARAGADGTAGRPGESQE